MSDIISANSLSAAARFTVVVVNYNGEKMLLDCAQSVIEAGISETQLIVVDNGSRDQSLQQLQNHLPTCRIIRNGCNAGFARAVNKGLREVTTEFAILLNNDARLGPAAPQALAIMFDSHAQAAILGGRLRYEDGRLQNAVAAFPTLTAEILPKALLRWRWPQRYAGRPTGDIPLQVESVIGALLAVRMDAAKQIGLLDEDFFFFLEETEWCLRATQRGWQVWHVPAAVAIHAQGGTAKRYNALARVEYQRSKLLYFRKTTPARYPLILIILFSKAGLNALFNGVACVLSLGLPRRLREKTAVYLSVLGWYLRGRPADVGLPDKCPREN
jgi:N-acetylglucosaminyl-diphospho-decaprenol L-rhamnosyltransferase